MQSDESIAFRSLFFALFPVPARYSAAITH